MTGGPSAPAPDWGGALARAAAHAPFLAGLIARQPALVERLAAGAGDEALALARSAGAGAPDIGTALRRERRALALVLAIGDLAGAFPLARVTAELSAFADRALDAAIREALQQRVPEAEPAGFIALALGKHGAEELNYSSDIDPILLFDPERMPRLAREEPGEAAARYARRVVQTLARIDAEGYVFRVDLRLRPASEVSPPALSLDAALTHYESSALAWERAAFIRARACAGDIPAGQAFLAAIRPFVWRKSLDFGAIAEIGRLTARIREAKEGPLRPGPGFNLKTGRGGIREVEFFAQTHQLIHGGRNPALRLRGVRATLDALAAAGLIHPENARVLGDSYDRLRTLEHRLQMVLDQQTHALPTDPAALDNVARLDGLPDGAALVAELTAITEAVGSRYDTLIAAHGNPSGASMVVPAQGSAEAGGAARSLVEQLAALGFDDAAGLAERVEGWKGGRVRALRSEAARAAFDAIQPALLAALARSPEPVRAFNRWEQLLTRLPSALNLFHLLEARPALLELLAKVLSLAPPLADALAARPDLLDPLIDASAFDLPGGVAELVAEFSAGEADDDYERLLDRVRRRVGERRFTLGVQLIEGATDPLALAAANARVAEAALRVLADAATAEFEAAHGKVPGGELVVLGLGRFGGGALTHASDLDLIYLFTGDFAVESDGPRPLGASLYFNRLATRISAALSVPTAAGALYEVDTRLRPSGTQGPLAASLDSFARYQHEQAWTWEHMALCRARPVYGSPAAQAALAAIVGEVLLIPRDRAKLRSDVLEMRARMAAHKPPQGPLDAKLLRGGLVDLEFIVHFLQLATGQGLSPALPQALRGLAGVGLVPERLALAHDRLTRLLVAARLLAPKADEHRAGPRSALAAATGYANWDSVTAGLVEARTIVAEAWRQVFEDKLEIA
ncbi:bifunctional [glutamine synthetase] adenylyltransferase/[glutamine synthetase]-adenylyl-L-tyrosine phosphorylase [Novosphingobium piscinae]|uniref:Bifunctional [glutamine synthetase] adenylyltransferase/[glutamine synthetase]-adenylyl-L-tyrosine phosphorylase n=1 Tax=Novosphingobium piscinae TaxID=1507448 RepID=A0A7X1G0B6_9SPHN|nr:bifunctional [glutamine synthetase] adenylyltransferase/[glutamine synthetase]-adenylyl-L-tyrosine phosphorylase [Novosphingobium piscinae]MBC2670325.1 bifunctional [glutamine synthetase] adenylyltransferase/[glutamine synthetase]-adenylyl-L-tyrosine phosphorylase [Novosphingobium piscinae]